MPKYAVAYCDNNGSIFVRLICVVFGGGNDMRKCRYSIDGK